jgi:hypothetical protein
MDLFLSAWSWRMDRALISFSPAFRSMPADDTGAAALYEQARVSFKDHFNGRRQ